jgi:4-amino-4-deoxy-L-arabinose transferase-like glycosyltransferase
MRTLASGQPTVFARKLLTRATLTSDTALLIYLGLVSLVVHVLVAGNYGYFRDELYYLADGRHLAPGYVDQPPLIGLLAAIVHVTLGDSLVAIHIIPAIVCACLVVVVGLMARELGGGRFAQLLAALAALVTLVFMATGSIFSMDVIDELCWALGAYIVIRLIHRDQPRLWLLFGLVAGIGLANKLTMLFFGFALAVALLLTPARAYFRSRWLWLGGAIAFAFLLPYLLWNAANGWPTVDFWRHYGGLSGGGPVSFLANQILSINPLNLPIAIAGLFFYFRNPEGKPYRVLGWTYVVLYALFTVMNAKPYFLTPAYSILYAGGVLTLERAVRRARWSWVRFAYPALLVASGAFFAPLAMPVLPPATFVSDYGFMTALGNGGAGQSNAGAFPQYLGDRFGWDTMTATVAQVYDALPVGERSQACIFTVNYGEAGALQLLGTPYHLPPVISGHNNYYLWGPGNCSGSVLITVGMTREDMAKSYASVIQSATITCEYCQAQENNLPVYVCTQPKVNPRDAWLSVKHFN